MGGGDGSGQGSGGWELETNVLEQLKKKRRLKNEEAKGLNKGLHD